MSDRIIIADDHPIFRDGMRRIVQRTVPGAVIQEAGTAEELLRHAADGESASMLILDFVLHLLWGSQQRTGPSQRLQSRPE